MARCRGSGNRAIQIDVSSVTTIRLRVLAAFRKGGLLGRAAAFAVLRERGEVVRPVFAKYLAAQYDTPNDLAASVTHG
jgi:hypothetical protein